jgi:intracellular septation protein A
MWLNYIIKVRVSSFLSRHTISTLKQAKRVIIIVFGSSLLLFGIALFFTPGPAIIVIPIALGILATEFVWAKKLLDRFNSRIRNFRKKKNKGR